MNHDQERMLRYRAEDLRRCGVYAWDAELRRAGLDPLVPSWAAPSTADSSDDLAMPSTARDQPSGPSVLAQSMAAERAIKGLDDDATWEEIVEAPVPDITKAESLRRARAGLDALWAEGQTDDDIAQEAAYRAELAIRLGEYEKDRVKRRCKPTPHNGDQEAAGVAAPAEGLAGCAGVV